MNHDSQSTWYREPNRRIKIELHADLPTLTAAADSTARTLACFCIPSTLFNGCSHISVNIFICFRNVLHVTVR